MFLVSKGCLRDSVELRKTLERVYGAKNKLRIEPHLSLEPQMDSLTTEK